MALGRHPLIGLFMFQQPFFRFLLLCCCCTSLLACSSEAVNRDRMVNLDNGTLKTEIKLEDLNLAMKQDRDNAVLYAKRALLYLERKQHARALADINQALELDDEKGEYYFRKALILREAGNMAAAQEAASEAENHGYKETDVFVLQAELLIRLQDYPEALEKVHYALEEAPDHAYALFYRGVARAASQDTASALINYRLVLKNAPAFADAYLQLASIYNARKDYLMAQHYLKGAARLAPDQAFWWLQQGIRHRGLRQTDSAFYSLQKAIALNPKLTQAHYHLGLLYQKRMDFPAVVRHLEIVQAVADTLPGVQEYLAEGYEKTGRFKEALHLYQQVLARTPNDVRAGWGVRRSNWGLYKIQRDSLRQKNQYNRVLLDSIKRINY